MFRRRHDTILLAFAVLALTCSGCAQRNEAPLEPPERFAWVSQPIEFSPPPATWTREAENSGGLLGVRFVLTGGGGQRIIVAAHRQIAERDRKAALESLLAEHASLVQKAFLKRLSRARAPTDDPVSEREAQVAYAINAALDRAQADYLGDHPGFVSTDLEEALRTARAYQPTMAELLPRLRIRPEERQDPERWRSGIEHDSTINWRDVFVSEDTLLTPERPLIYREVFWVEGGCAFSASFQGLPKERRTFDRLVASIAFPEEPDAAPR